MDLVQAAAGVVIIVCVLGIIALDVIAFLRRPR